MQYAWASTEYEEYKYEHQKEIRLIIHVKILYLKCYGLGTVEYPPFKLPRDNGPDGFGQDFLTNYHVRYNFILNSFNSYN